jgi:hypothetical protein
MEMFLSIFGGPFRLSFAAAGGGGDALPALEITDFLIFTPRHASAPFSIGINSAGRESVLCTNEGMVAAAKGRG